MLIGGGIVLLGITPYGSTGRKWLWADTVYRGSPGRYDTSATRYIGTHQVPDIETIAALKPDLILGLSYHAPLRDKLSLIAPVVLLPVREEGIRTYAAQLADLTDDRIGRCRWVGSSIAMQGSA